MQIIKSRWCGFKRSVRGWSEMPPEGQDNVLHKNLPLPFCGEIVPLEILI